MGYKTIVLALATAGLLGGCGSALDSAGSPGTGRDGVGGKADELTTRSESVVAFDEFRDGLYREPDDGPYIVQGDVPIWGDEALRAYYDERVELASALTVMQSDAVDSIWDSTERQHLTFCISDLFRDRKGEVVEAFMQAIGEWEAIANVDFVYRPDQDGRCHWRNAQVKFHVRPTPDDGWAPYIARAFFPHQPRDERSVLINLAEHDAMLASDDIEGDYTLLGVLRHELGHVLGFRHEHIRDEAAAFFCTEDDDYRVITEYDSASVMHYPQCNGTGDWSLPLTDTDRRGAAFFYPDFDDFVARRCDRELTDDGKVDDSCEPVTHELVELANKASFEVLDEWVGLDVRAVEEIVVQRETRPFSTLDELREIRYFADGGVRGMYDYLYVDGRCADEIDDGLVNAECKPVVNRILEFANAASRDELDFDARLDRRAAANIVAIRKERPFGTLAELWDVDYVKTRALGKMYRYLYE